MSSSGVVSFSTEDLDRARVRGIDWRAVLVASGELTQAGAALVIGAADAAPSLWSIVAPSPEWQLPYFSGNGSTTPWVVSSWSTEGGGNTNTWVGIGSLRIELRVGSVQRWWFADLRSGAYAIPPCDELRVSVGAQAGVFGAQGPLTVQASLAPHTQGFVLRPWYARAVQAVDLSMEGTTTVQAYVPVAPYTTRWRPYILWPSGTQGFGAGADITVESQSYALGGILAQAPSWWSPDTQAAMVRYDFGISASEKTVWCVVECEVAP